MKPDPLAAIPSTGKKTNLTDRLPMPDYIGGMKHGRYNRYHEPRRYGGGRPRRGGRSLSLGGYVAGALLIGVAAGTGWLFTMPEGRQVFMTSAKDIAVSTGMMRKRAPQEGDYWRGCGDARAAGTAPIYHGEPGYREGMDGDDDGIACEPYY